MVNPIRPAKLSRKTLLVGLWVGVIISIGFFVFRIYVRQRVFHRLHLDDAFLLAALLLALANASLWQATSYQLYLSIAISSGQIPLPPSDIFPQIYTYLHSQIASLYLYTTSLWLVKASFLWFFRGLGRKIKRQRIIWWSVAVFTGAAFCVCVGMFDYGCLAGPNTPSTLAHCSSVHASQYEYVTTRVTTAFDIVTDGLIILVSTNILWNVQIDIRKKLALAGIFSLTLFTIAMAIIRITVATDGPKLDLTWIIFWGGLENSVAIIVACLASFRTLYAHSDRTTPPQWRLPRFQKMDQFQSNSPGIPLKSQGYNRTYITASKESDQLHPQASTGSSEANILPLDAVYIRQDFGAIQE